MEGIMLHDSLEPVPVPPYSLDYEVVFSTGDQGAPEPIEQIPHNSLVAGQDGRKLLSQRRNQLVIDGNGVQQVRALPKGCMGLICRNGDAVVRIQSNQFGRARPGNPMTSHANPCSPIPHQ